MSLKLDLLPLADGHLLCFPVFMLVDADGDALEATNDDGQKNFPMWTTAQAAHDMLAGNISDRQFTIVGVRDAEDLLAILIPLQISGFTHILFDVVGDKGLLAPIPLLRRRLLAHCR